MERIALNHDMIVSCIFALLISSLRTEPSVHCTIYSVPFAADPIPALEKRLHKCRISRTSGLCCCFGYLLRLRTCFRENPLSAGLYNTDYCGGRWARIRLPLLDTADKI